MSRAWVQPLLSACVAVGCLPPDSRPTPGSVFVSAQPSEATRSGFSNAAADADDDGNIAFAELEEVPAEVFDEWLQEGLSEEDEPEAEATTLGGVVYQLLLPRVTRLVGGGVCEAEVRGRR